MELEELRRDYFATLQEDAKQRTMFEGAQRRANMCESLSQVAARRA